MKPSLFYERWVRWNSPYINHFLSPDTIIPDQTNPQSWDRYAYTFNNPLRYSDPSGHCPICIGLVIVGAFFIFNGTNDSYQPNLSSAELESRQASVNIGASLMVSSYAIQYPIIEAASNIYDCATGFCDPSLMLPGSSSAYVNTADDLADSADDLTDAVHTIDNLPNDALVCRGGTCMAERFETGAGVTLNADGTMTGVSVNSAPGVSVNELTKTIPNGQVGVTTVGDIRLAGGNVIPDPLFDNPYHSLMSGITPTQAQDLFTPTIQNPNRLTKR